MGDGAEPFKMKCSLQLSRVPDAGDSGVGRGLLARELTHGTFSVFSVLHDPLEGKGFANLQLLSYSPHKPCHSV